MIKEISKQIENILMNDFEVDKGINYEDPLILYGIDSLNYIKLLVSIEKHFNVKFDDSALSYSGMNTIYELSQKVEELTMRDSG